MQRILFCICKINLILLAVLLLGCSSSHSDFLSAEDQEWLEQQKGQLEVLFGYQAPPEAYTDEKGHYVGLHVDILKEIESLIGYDFTFRNFETWNELLDYSKTSDNFIIIGIEETEERLEYLSFTNSFINIPYIIITRDKSHIESIDDLSGRIFCTVKDYAVNDFIMTYYPELHPLHVDTERKGLVGVSNGGFDAMVVSQMSASYLIETEEIVNLRAAGGSGYLNKLSVAVPENNYRLYGILEQTVDQITPETRQNLYRKWVDPTNRRLDRSDWILIGILASIIAFILLFLWGWLLLLKNEVKRQTRRYRKLAKDFRIILNSITDGVVTTDKTGHITMMNPVAEQLSGWVLEEAKGKLIQTVLDMRDREGKRFIKKPVFPEGSDTVLSRNVTLTSLKGEEFQINLSGSALIENNEVIGAVSILRDITEQLKNENELLNAKKMESMGVLAGGIAHDFNNILTGLFGFIEMAKISLTPDSQSYRYLEMALQSFNRTTRLTNQLLTFSKGGDPVRKNLSLIPVIEETAEFTLHGSKVKLNTRFDPKLWQVDADKGQISQVIGNLVINAQQAMPDGGILTIMADNIETGNGLFVQIKIRDNGIGIPPQFLEKVFDPYFSTKQKGSGLGLASTHSIITKHNGTIHVKSEQNRGTEFTIRLPARKKQTEDLKENSVSENPIQKRDNSKRILVLDDEEYILEIFKEMLHSLGYEVVTVQTGDDAIRIYREYMDKGTLFDLLITDLTIPGETGGADVAKKILTIHPAARIIISSGYSSDTTIANFRKHGFKGVIAKPFNLKDLAHTVEEALKQSENAD